jgi:hypothetical protein
MHLIQAEQDSNFPKSTSTSRQQHHERYNKCSLLCSALFPAIHGDAEAALAPDFIKQVFTSFTRSLELRLLQSFCLEL